MRAEDILAYVRATPFRPFRIVMNSGQTYEIRHPEWVKVGRTTLLYFYLTQPDDVYDRYVTISLSLIQHVEHVDQPAKGPSSGAA